MVASRAARVGPREILATTMRLFRRERPKALPLWVGYYRQWLQTAVKLAWRVAGVISLLLSLLVPAGILAYKHWGGDIPPKWEGKLNALIWAVPLGVATC